MRKVTMRDIAKLADVSTATVSYVLNNNEKEKIPDETRNRILSIANELGYVPNLTARSLVKRKSGLIGVIVVRDYENEGLWKKCFYNEFVNELEKLLSDEGYHILISNIDCSQPKLDIILERELDAVFIIDVNKEFFFSISNKFTVPIIIIDSYIDDLIFQKVVPDFEDALSKARTALEEDAPFYVINNYNNAETVKKLMDACFSQNVYVVDSLDGLKEFLQSQTGKKGIVVNEFLGAIASRYIDPDDLAVICTCGNDYLLHDKTKKVIIDNAKKAEIAVHIMNDLLNRDYSHDKYIVIKAE